MASICKWDGKVTMQSRNRSRGKTKSMASLGLSMKSANTACYLQRGMLVVRVANAMESTKLELDLI